MATARELLLKQVEDELDIRSNMWQRLSDHVAAVPLGGEKPAPTDRLSRAYAKSLRESVLTFAQVREMWALLEGWTASKAASELAFYAPGRHASAARKRAALRGFAEDFGQLVLLDMCLLARQHRALRQYLSETEGPPYLAQEAANVLVYEDIPLRIVMENASNYTLAECEAKARRIRGGRVAVTTRCARA